MVPSLEPHPSYSHYLTARMGAVLWFFSKGPHAKGFPRPLLIQNNHEKQKTKKQKIRIHQLLWKGLFSALESQLLHSRRVEWQSGNHRLCLLRPSEESPKALPMGPETLNSSERPERTCGFPTEFITFNLPGPL